MTIATPELRAKLRDQFSAALANDPVCGGRVTVATVDWLVDEAIRAGEAMARKARLQQLKVRLAKGRARGGFARAASLSPDRRSEIARRAAQARWHGREA